MTALDLVREARAVYDLMREALGEGERRGFEMALTVLEDVGRLHGLQRAGVELEGGTGAPPGRVSIPSERGPGR